jgi:hypothetical protein
MIEALAFDGKGTLYAGTNGVTRGSYVCKRSGPAWSVVGEIHGSVKGLATDRRGNLYACGYFDSVAGIHANGVAKWDGSSWSALGRGIRDSISRYPANVHGALMRGDDLYVYGDFDSAGETATRAVARWDGSSWSPVGNKTVTYAGSLVADRSGGVYACELYYGSFKEGPYVAKLDGNEWRNLDLGAPYSPSILLIDNSANIFGLCEWNFMRLHEGAWSFVFNGNGIDGEINALAIDTVSGNSYAGGSFSSIGDQPMNNIARWNGGAWTALGDGTRFTVNAIALGRDGTLFAGGWPKQDTFPLLARWDGVAWHTMDKGRRRAGVASIKYVSSLAVDAAGNLYAGGVFDTLGGTAARNIAKWDGVSWSCPGTGIAGDVKALAFDKNGNLYAGGNFDKAGGVIAHNIAKWDGLSWSSLGEGIQKDPDSYDPVKTLALDETGILFAGGDFSIAGGVEALNIAKWDGASWSGLGSGLQITDSEFRNYTRINALTFDGEGNLYAAGCFDVAGSVQAHNIAKWDGAVWNALGSGLSSLPDHRDFDYCLANAVTCDKKGILHVGGGFSYAGGKVSANFARCNLKGPVETKSARGRTDRHGPISYEAGNGMLRVRLAAPAVVHIRVYSLSGRQVRRASEFMAAGDHAVWMKALDLAGSAYIAQVKAGGASLTYRFAIE